MIFATLHNAGVRVYDIGNAFQPREAGISYRPIRSRWWQPAAEPAAGDLSCDCYVDPQGVMYLTDSNAGLNILQFEGG